MDLYNRRIPNFYRILTDHNLSEEDQIFPKWKLIDDSRKDKAIKDAVEIIESDDKANYLDKTGFSEEFIKYMI